MDTIMITGAEGFFASRFVQFYTDRYNIVSLKHRELDICNEQKTINTIKELKPKYVVHAAGISDTGICESNPELSYNVNVEGTANIAKGCEASHAKLIYLSSDQIYNGNVESGPYTEECRAIPNTVYGKHKAEAENTIFEIIDDAVILRLTWLFGLPERTVKINSNIIWNIVKSVLKNERITLPANEFRGITYIYDLIQNFDKILGLTRGIYNTGSESNLSTYEAGKIVVEKMGLAWRTEELLIKDTDRYVERPRDLRISNKKLQEYNIYFSNTEEAIIKCIEDFSFIVK